MPSLVQVQEMSRESKDDPIARRLKFPIKWIVDHIETAALRGQDVITIKPDLNCCGPGLYIEEAHYFDAPDRDICFRHEHLFEDDKAVERAIRHIAYRIPGFSEKNVDVLRENDKIVGLRIKLFP